MLLAGIPVAWWLERWLTQPAEGGDMSLDDRTGAEMAIALIRSEADVSKRQRDEARAEADRLRALAVRLRDALAFYADPDTYFAVGFFPDPPCGAIMDDWSTHGTPGYAADDERPGWVARTALADPEVQMLLARLWCE